MEWLREAFEDKKILEYSAKVSLVFGPGFLFLGYFQRNVFLQLDWFKLLAFCGLFSIIFVLPSVLVMWMLKNFWPWKLQWQLDRYNSRLDKFDKDARALAEEVHEMKHNSDGRLTTAIDNLNSEVAALIKEIGGSKKRFSHRSESLNDLRTDFLSVLLDYWLYFLLLFMIVLLVVGVSYFEHTHTTSRWLISLLLWQFYLLLPLFTVGLWTIGTRKLVTSRKVVQLMLILAGLVCMAIGGSLYIVGFIRFST